MPSDNHQSVYMSPCLSSSLLVPVSCIGVTGCQCSYAPRSTWPPYVSHPPREMDETCRPERPRNRYVMGGSPSGLAVATIVSESGGNLEMFASQNSPRGSIATRSSCPFISTSTHHSSSIPSRRGNFDSHLQTYSSLSNRRGNFCPWPSTSS